MGGCLSRDLIDRVLCYVTLYFLNISTFDHDEYPRINIAFTRKSTAREVGLGERNCDRRTDDDRGVRRGPVPSRQFRGRMVAPSFVRLAVVIVSR